MNPNKFFRHLKPSFVAGYVMAMAASCVITSCKDDDTDNGPAYFMFEDLEGYELPFEGISNDAFGNGAKFTIRANGSWKIIPENEEEAAWMQIWPAEGVDDGYVRCYCDQNASAYKRSANFILYLNGVEQPERIVITQQNSQPTLTVNSKALTFERTGGELSISVTSNIEWECFIEGSDSQFFKATQTENLAVVECPETNTSGRELEAKLIIRGTGEYHDMRHEIALTQLVAIFFDNFSWLKSKAGILGWETPVENEKRIDNWTAEEKSHGWISYSTWAYSRTGFIKLGKGKYGGDIASPCITELDGPANVTISFKVVGYGDKKSVKDPIERFYVGVLGPGTITGCNGADGVTGETIPYQNADKIKVNIPAVKFGFAEHNWFLKNIDPTGLDVWQLDECNYSISVSGMDQTSRIVFVAGKAPFDDKYSDPDGKTQRLFLDDFKVVQN